jgi:hypothetical protein
MTSELDLETMLEHMSLRDVARFVVDRENLRRFPSEGNTTALISSAAVLGPDTEKDMSPPSSAKTLPACGVVLDVEPDPFPTIQESAA